MTIKARSTCRPPPIGGPALDPEKATGTWNPVTSATSSGELSRGRWHGRGGVIDDEPTLAALDVGEAVARRQALRLSILDVSKCVISCVDGRTAIHADQLIAERNFEDGKNFERRHKIVPERGPISAHRRRQRSPKDRIIGIERQHLVGIVLAESPSPRQGRFGNFLF